MSLLQEITEYNRCRENRTLTIPENHVNGAIELSMMHQLYEFDEHERGHRCKIKDEPVRRLSPWASEGAKK